MRNEYSLLETQKTESCNELEEEKEQERNKHWKYGAEATMELVAIMMHACMHAQEKQHHWHSII